MPKRLALICDRFKTIGAKACQNKKGESMRIKLDEKKVKEFINLGVPKSKIAEHLGISTRSLFRYLKKINNEQTSKTINETKKENINATIDNTKSKKNHNVNKLSEMSEEERNTFLEEQLKKTNKNILK